VETPKGKVIKPGQTIIIRDEGMPTYKRPDQKGNLYVVLEVEFPEDGWLNTIDEPVSSTSIPFNLFLSSRPNL
jgi:DnaJ homolog subfamily A member 2